MPLSLSLSTSFQVVPIEVAFVSRAHASTLQMGRGLKFTLLLWETDKRFRLDSESCSDSVGKDIQDHLVPAPATVMLD